MAEGYDTKRFHSDVDENFICGICLGVLKDPMQCEKNEHYFCSGCIKKHLEKNTHSCPSCQEKLTVETLRKAPRVVVDVVSRYKISCDHATRGCDVVLELRDLQAHVQDCDFMPVSCSNEGCDEVLNKRDVKHHEIELCRFKITTCYDCGKRMPRHKYGAHGCVLRRDFDEMKKDLAEVKVTQHDMMDEVREGMQRITIAIEKLQKSSGSIASSVVFIGGVGCRTGKTTSSVECFNLFKHTWKPLGELKVGRYALAAVVFRNQILACGGCTSSCNNPTDSIEVLDLNVNPPTWQEFAVKLPIRVYCHKCVVYDNRLLIIGGIMRTQHGSSGPLDTIYELLLVPPYSFKFLCHMKKTRAHHGVELFDDKILIAGGKNTPTDAVEMYDITRNECVEMPPLPSPLYSVQTARRDDTMLLTGMSGNSDNYIIEYDFKSGESKVLKKWKRVVCSAVFCENTLVVFSYTKDGTASLHCFNFLSNSWKKLHLITQARTSTSAVVVNNFEY